jgi:hypothetical protein
LGLGLKMTKQQKEAEINRFHCLKVKDCSVNHDLKINLQGT